MENTARKAWHGVKGVFWSFELHDDLAALYNKLSDDEEGEKVLSLLSDWL